MNKKGTRATNGEGYIGTTIQKIKKKFDNTNMCKICANCKDRTDCNNRQGHEKCDKCKNCKEECFHYCDRFYCRKMVLAQITVDGEQKTVGTKTNRKDTVAAKKKKEADAENGTFVKKSNKTLYHFCKDVEKDKINAKLIKTSTQSRNKDTFKKLQNADFYEKPIQKITKKEIDSFINSYTYLSQSEIDKIVSQIQIGYERAVEEDVISYKKNFMRNYTSPLSDKEEKEVVAFELDEFLTLMKYILTTDRLIKNSKCNYDTRTIRNLIILSFLSITRIR